MPARYRRAKTRREPTLAMVIERNKRASEARAEARRAEREMQEARRNPPSRQRRIVSMIFSVIWVITHQIEIMERMLPYMPRQTKGLFEIIVYANVALQVIIAFLIMKNVLGG